jgi:uncharacterized membrane protein YebE (DUF533 family)
MGSPGAISPMGVQGGGTDFKKLAGLGALGYLAYKAFQERQRNSAGPQGNPDPAPDSGIFGGLFGGGQPGVAGGKGDGAGSLGDRLSEMFRPRQQGTPDAEALPDVVMEDRKALLLIRAMIAAANADGEITPEERQRILSKLDEAGAGPEERQVVERELAAPMPMDALVREARDGDMVEQVYLASLLAMEPDTEAERSYLQYLAARMGLSPQQAEQLRQVA